MCVYVEVASCPSYHLQQSQHRPWHSRCHSSAFSTTGKWCFSPILFFCMSSQFLRQQLRILIVLWFLMSAFALFGCSGGCLVDTVVGVRSQRGLGRLRGLFQPKWFCGSVSAVPGVGDKRRSFPVLGGGCHLNTASGGAFAVFVSFRFFFPVVTRNETYSVFTARGGGDCFLRTGCLL